MIKKAFYFFLVISATMLVSCSAKETDSSTNLPVVSVVKPVSGSLQESVSFSGYVEAEAMIYVIPMVSGTIKEYPVKIGENVKEGTLSLIDTVKIFAYFSYFSRKGLINYDLKTLKT